MPALRVALLGRPVKYGTRVGRRAAEMRARLIFVPFVDDVGAGAAVDDGLVAAVVEFVAGGSVLIWWWWQESASCVTVMW